MGICRMKLATLSSDYEHDFWSSNQWRSFWVILCYRYIFEFLKILCFNLTEAPCVLLHFIGRTAEWEWCSFKTWWMTDQSPSCLITSFSSIFRSRFQNKRFVQGPWVGWWFSWCKCMLQGTIFERATNPGRLGHHREHYFEGGAQIGPR